ncbi:MAG: TnpV protein [Clostridia bacterium]|nr:TnpV protein [Clostridia bacterium]
MNTNPAITADIAYEAVGDYLLPMIALPESSGPIGHFGRLRKAFLKKHRPLTFQTMLLNGTLDNHLADLNRQATERKEALIRQMAAEEGVNEELKAADPMAWVQRMNNLRACAEEIILKEMVYD